MEFRYSGQWKYGQKEVQMWVFEFIYKKLIWRKKFFWKRKLIWFLSLFFVLQVAASTRNRWRLARVHRKKMMMNANIVLVTLRKRRRIRRNHLAMTIPTPTETAPMIILGQQTSVDSFNSQKFLHSKNPFELLLSLYV